MLQGNFVFLEYSRLCPLLKAELKKQWPNLHSKFHLLKEQKLALVEASAPRKAQHPSWLGSASLNYFEVLEIK